MAQAKLESARVESEALLIAGDAKRKVEEMQGLLFQKFPLLYELELAKIKAQALKGATLYITPQDLGNFFNTPVPLFNALPQQQPQGYGSVRIDPLTNL